jgi:hypothetical protein
MLIPSKSAAPARRGGADASRGLSQHPTALVAPSWSLTMSQPAPENRCEHSDAGGRRSRMPRHGGHPSLCANHARQELLEFQDRQNFARELLGPIKDFQSAAAINHALGRLYVLLGANRINTRQAAVLAYICQLMLQSLHGVNQEVESVSDEEFTESELLRVLDSLTALDPKLGSSKDGPRKS